LQSDQNWRSAGDLNRQSVWEDPNCVDEVLDQKSLLGDAGVSPDFVEI